MVVGVIYGTAGNFDLLETDSVEENVAIDNGQAATTIVVSQTTAGNNNADVLSGTPNGSSGAQALSSSAVVVNWAVGRNVVTSVGKSAPGSSGVES